MQLEGDGRAAQEEVHVSAAGHLGPGHVGRGGQGLGQARGDVARLLPEGPGQIERRREREVAQLQPGRVLEGHGRQLHAEGGASGLACGRREPGLQPEDHVNKRKMIISAARGQSATANGLLPSIDR